MQLLEIEAATKPKSFPAERATECRVPNGFSRHWAPSVRFNREGGKTPILQTQTVVAGIAVSLLRIRSANLYGRSALEDREKAYNRCYAGAACPQRYIAFLVVIQK
jgi:hypothetical protein